MTLPRRPPGYITASEAAIRLRLSRERVVRLVQTGELAGKHDPRRGWFVRKSHVEVRAKALGNRHAQ